MIRVQDTVLTQEEREFSEANAALLEQFFRIYRLDDECYGRLSERYLKTVRRYFREPVLREKYRFSTIVRLNLRSELSHILREGRHIEYQMAPGTMERLSSDHELESAIALWDILEQSLTRRQLEVLRMRLEGLTGTEIARICEITVRAVERRVSRLRKRAKENIGG